MLYFADLTGAMCVTLLSMQRVGSKLSFLSMVYVENTVLSNFYLVVIGLSTFNQHAALQLVGITH